MSPEDVYQMPLYWSIKRRAVLGARDTYIDRQAAHARNRSQFLRQNGMHE